MKKIILLLATFALGASMALPAQTIATSGEGSGPNLLAQNENQQVQAGSSGGSGNNRNSQTVAVQQNGQNMPSGWSGSGGGGGIGRFGGRYSYRVQNVLSRYPGTAEPPLVVRSSDMDPKNQANLEEDLAVMAHILDKALDDLPSGRAHTRSAMGIDLF